MKITITVDGVHFTAEEKATHIWQLQAPDGAPIRGASMISHMVQDISQWLAEHPQATSNQEKRNGRS